MASALDVTVSASCSQLEAQLGSGFSSDVQGKLIKSLRGKEDHDAAQAKAKHGQGSMRSWWVGGQGLPEMVRTTFPCSRKRAHRRLMHKVGVKKVTDAAGALVAHEPTMPPPDAEVLGSDFHGVSTMVVSVEPDSRMHAYTSGVLEESWEDP